MTALIVIAAILLVFALLCLIPITLELEAKEGTFSAKLRLGYIKLFPKKPKSKKPKKVKSSKPPSKQGKTLLNTVKSLGLSSSEWLNVLKAVLKAVGSVGSAVRVPVLKLCITVSDPDPYKTVMNYNYANTALYTLLPYMEKALKIKERDIRLTTDYERERLYFELHTISYIRIGRLLLAAIVAIWRIVAIIIGHKLKHQRSILTRF